MEGAASDRQLIGAYLGARNDRERRLAGLRIERYLPPLAVAELRAALAARGMPVPGGDGGPLAGLPRTGRLQPFIRRPLSPDADFYGGDGFAAGMTEGKTLILGFCGMTGRLGLPAAALLQALPARRVDVVLLRDPARAAFRQGAGAYAASWPALLERLRRDLGPDRYAGLVTLGSSMGARPALRAGAYLRAGRAVGIGTRRPNDALMALSGRDPGPGFDPFCACAPAREGLRLLVHAQHCRPDAEAAAQFQAAGAGRAVMLGGMDDHNLLWRMWQMGELRAFLALLLFAEFRGQGAVTLGRLWPPRIRAGLRRRGRALLGRVAGKGGRQAGAAG